jgi:hypothetical protein
VLGACGAQQALHQPKHDFGRGEHKGAGTLTPEQREQGRQELQLAAALHQALCVVASGQGG